MALTTYAELKTSLGSWSHRSDIDSIADDLVTLAEAYIYRKLRIVEMESALATTIVGVTAAVPSDYLGMRYAYIDASQKYPLKVVAPDVLYTKYPTSQTGMPAYVSRDRTSFIFGPSPAESNVMRGTYYAKPAALAVAVNAVFTAVPDVYLFAALSELEAFTENDPRIALWQSKRDAAIASANGNAMAQNFSGPLVSQVS